MTNEDTAAGSLTPAEQQGETRPAPAGTVRPEGLTDKDGEAVSAEGITPGDTSHLGAVETDVTATATPVPGGGGNPDAPTSPADETPGG